MTLKPLPTDFQANLLEKENFTIDFEDQFDDKELDTTKWIPYYLPQWSCRQKSRPNYQLKNKTLTLEITADQQPWCPEFNGNVKCSSIQTGVYAGSLGSNKGQHKFNRACIVREEQKNEKLYLTQYGHFEIRAKCNITSSNVVALWLIGYEEKTEESGELCIVEIKGENIKSGSAVIGYGIHKFNDPTLTEQFYEEQFGLDVSMFHIYSAEWTPDKIDFYIDNQRIKTINQSPTYPMQLMLNIYEIPDPTLDNNIESTYPKEFIIDYIRVYKRV